MPPSAVPVNHTMVVGQQYKLFECQTAPLVHLQH